MKSIRQRMSKKLAISTAKEDCRKRFSTMTEAEFAKTYVIKGQVMESTHQGMSVLFANRQADGIEVVVKVRDRATSFKGNSEEREWRATTEVQLNMPKIDSMCEYYEVIETRENYYVVMEKVEGKDLFEQMAEEHIKQADAREIVRQVLAALVTMHNAGRIHKDLKLENVVVDMDSPKTRKAGGSASPGTGRSSGGVQRVGSGGTDSPPHSPVEAKLIDFDTVENWEPSSPKSKDVLGTDGYIAPEAYSGDYSPASDIYCVGVIMYKLLTRKFPSNPEIFDDKPGENWVGSPAMKRIRERLRTEKMDFARPPLDRCKDASSLLQSMLQYEPGDRPSAEQALNHHWFSLDASELASPRSPHGGSRSKRSQH
jgi:serine/threonine protein kinase